MSETLRYRRSTIPEGRAGEWVIERFRVRKRPENSEEPSDIRPYWARARPGEYTRLRRASVDYMTDLYEEWHSQRAAMREAVERGGDVLITGLGLGLVVDSLLACDAAIRSMTVLELSPEVVDLVEPHLRSRDSKRLQILHADAFSWAPPESTRYSVVWHDIWPNPFENRCVAESQRLFDRYAPWADWQGSWALEYRALAESAGRLPQAVPGS